MAHDAILNQAVTLAVNNIWQPIKKRIRYCLEPETHICNLEKSDDDLQDTIDTVQEKIEVGRREGKRPRTQATRWIESAKSVNYESHRIKNDYVARRKHVFGYSWNFIFNYSISTAATQVLIDIDEIKKRTPQGDGIFSLLPPVGRELPLPPNIMGQKDYMDKIIGYIKQGAASIIGICGMGGAGKTTLLKQLNNIFSCSVEEHEFDHVIYVETSQQQNLQQIQQTIASNLGLTLPQNENTLPRAASLYDFLKTRKFLLFLDDLWQTLDLEKVGIPQGRTQIGPQNRQTIIITTRLQQVCHRMKEDQVILLQRLKFNEAWSLFEANVGSRITSSTEIRGYANSIVKKCGGLPLALQVVGQAMAQKESEHEWKYAAMLLEQAQFYKVPDADSDLYSILYISYDNLPDERTKQCFLLFALASYRFVSPESNTIRFWMGHGLLDEDDDIENINLRGHSVVGCLKRAYLLEEHPLRKNDLRMHDCIYDLALWIVANKRDGSDRRWIVSDQRKLMDPKEWCTAERIHLLGNNNVTIPYSFCCPHLLTLILGPGSPISKFPMGFFQIASSLTYLDLSGSNIQELPPDIGALVYLQHLDLARTPIQSLPVELKLLKNLRHLYLCYTSSLRTMPYGILPALSMLRVLDLYSSGFFPEEEAWPYLAEFENLTTLQSLGITMGNFHPLSRIFNISRISMRSLLIRGMTGLKCLQASVGLFSKTRAQQLEYLGLSFMESLEELMIGEINVESDWCFQSLDVFRLHNLRKLESIVWKGVVPHTCFPRLRKLDIISCHSIKTITWIKQLPCLEVVYLINCNSLLELVSDEDEGTMPSATAFPCLRHLGLSDLRNLQNMCEGTLVFPCLQRLLVYKCPMLSKLPAKILNGVCVPLIIGEQHWWDKLSWEGGAGVKSNLVSFFRELHPGFQGSKIEVFVALFHGVPYMNKNRLGRLLHGSGHFGT